MKRRLQRGFTLIELMIVVAIIGILASIAIPQYQDYVTRARWADTYFAIGSFKNAVAECAQNNNVTLNNTCDSLALLTASGFWSGAMPSIKFGATVTLTAATAAIVIDASTVTQLGNCTVTFTPSPVQGSLMWSASNGAGCSRRQTGL